MKPLFDLENDIIPLSKFRQKSKSYLRQIQQKHNPLILTQNGESAAVVLSPADYQRLEYERNLYQAIAEGERDIQEGRTLSHEKLFKELLG